MAKAKAAEAAPVEEAAFEAGQSVKFLGYGEDVPDNERVLEEGVVYEIIEVTENGNPLVEIENPDFNPKKKENAETNPKLIQVECFPEEVEVVEAEEEAAAEEAPAKPAAKTAGKGKAAATKEAPAAKTTAKGGAKGKAAEAPAKKTAAKKGAAKPEPEVADEEKVDPLEVDLDNEDAEIVALVEGSDDLIATVQELEAEVGHTEWKMAGLLYHIKKAKTYLEIEGAAESGYDDGVEGFRKFLLDYFNIDYRKAMYLIEIYVNFTLAGIENPGEVVATLGWTKAQKIAKPMLIEGQDPAELVELAEQTAANDLSEIIKERVSVGGEKGTAGEKKKRITLKFRFFEAEAATVETVLNSVKDELGLKDVGDALLHIISEYDATHSGAAAEEAPAQTKAAATPAAKKVAAKKATAKA